MSDLSISVAMCTFNGCRFLGAQLESIAAQSHPPNELIICDDGSSDHSGKIVEQFAGKVGFPVKFAVNQTNLGSTKNFEKAIGLCQSSLVVLADQDDIWYRHKLERIQQSFHNSPTVVAAFSDADLIDQDGNALHRRLWPTFGFTPAEQKTFDQGNALSVLIRHPVVTGACMAFRRSLYTALAPIPENEIHDQWLSFLLAAMGRIGLIDEPLLQYRRHAHQQIGPGPANFRDQLTAAQGRGADFYAQEVRRFRQLQGRLEEQSCVFPDADDIRVTIENKLLHVTHRARLPRGRAARVPQILREAVNRNYWRYSGGWVSIVKDLVRR